MADKKPLVAGDAPAVVRQINSADTLDVPAIKLGTPLASQYGGLGLNPATSGYVVGSVPQYALAGGGVFTPSYWKHFRASFGKTRVEAGITTKGEPFSTHGASLVLGGVLASGVTSAALRVESHVGGVTNTLELVASSNGNLTWSGSSFYAEDIYASGTVDIGGDVNVWGGAGFNASATFYNGATFQPGQDVYANGVFYAVDLVLSGDERVSSGGVITTVAISSNQNDYFPVNSRWRWARISSTAAYSITGLRGDVGNGWIEGGRKLLTNVGAYNITLVHESGSSTAAYRFRLPGSSNLVLRPNGSVELIYDQQASRWRAIVA